MSIKLPVEWYIIKVSNNSEKKVVQSIKQVLALEGISDLVESIVIPVVMSTYAKRGKKVDREERIFPSYILIQAEMKDKLYHNIMKIKDVMGFLSSSGKPSPVPQAEIDRIFARMKEGANVSSKKITFNIGDYVKVIEGPFQEFVGVVEGIDKANGRLKVSMSIFGRPTPVDLEFTQVTKDREE